MMLNFHANAFVSGHSNKQATNTVMCECRVGVVQQPAMQHILQHQPELAHKLLFELASLDPERK